MGGENEENTKHAFADWRNAYARLTQNSENDASPSANTENVVFALRALLHPALRPFLFDPTLDIDETYPGLDQYARALLGSPAGLAALSQLGRDDSAALYEVGLLPRGEIADTVRSDDAPATVGAIWGSLYLPAKQAAVPCRVRAVWNPAPSDAPRKSLSHWFAPRPLRPVSRAMENAGHVALAAALAVLRCDPSGIPDALRPDGMVWDVCLPGEADALALSAHGDSLQLPLALAFLSLLTNAPIPAHQSATGALSAAEPSYENECGVAVRPVGFVAAKERALLFLGPKRRFFVPAAPAESGAMVATSDTQVPVRDLAEAFGHIDRAGETPVFTQSPVSQTAPDGTQALAKAMACFVVEPGRTFEPERETLARRTLARFSDSIDTTRDAWGNMVFWARFPTAESALDTAFAVTQTMRCFLPWPLPEDFFNQQNTQAGSTAARVGITVERGAKDILWGTNAKPRAEAVARAAAPGQTLVDCGEEWETGTTRTERESPHRLSLLGRFRLLDLGPPLALHGVRGRSEPQPASDAPGGALLDACSHNLPIEAAPLIGRDAEIARLLGLLAGKFRAPLVTLSGGSGVGKTRLALEAAARAAPFFSGGIWLAPIGGAQSEDDLAARIADAMEIRLHLGPENRTAAQTGNTLTAQVLHRIEQVNQPVLLVLDSAEAAPDTVQAFLAHVAQSPAHVTCFVTALEPLKAAGEVSVPVEPLGVPLAPLLSASASALADDNDDAVQTAVLQSPAGAFFLSRAGRAPQTGEWNFALSMCRALRGVPLALLLVAAQTPFLPYAEIAPQFIPPVSSTPLSAALPASSTAPTIVRSAFRSVYALLSSSEQTLLRRIAPLLIHDRESISGGASRAGWTRDAALAICEMDEEEASDALTGLQQRGLLTRHSVQNRAYFTCLPVIAEWALNLLERDESETKAALEAHARFFLRFAREKAQFWDTPDETVAFDELHTQRHQLRAVAAYLQETDPVAFLRFVADVGFFLRFRGMAREWRDWPRRAVRFIELGGKVLGDTSTPEAAQCFALLYQFCAVNALNGGDVRGVLAYTQSGLGIARKANHRRDCADLLNVRAIAHDKLGHDALALADWREARALYETIGNKRGIVSVLNGEGKFWEARKNWDAARACHEEQEEICRRTHDTRGLCYALGNLGCNAFFRNRAEEAQIYLTEQLTLARQLKDAEAMANALLNLGDVLDALCNAPGPAVPLLALSEQIYAKLYHPLEKEAAKYLARIAPLYGEGNIELWRRDFARRTLSELVAYPVPLPHHVLLPTDSSGKKEFFLPSWQKPDENRGV